MKHKTTELELIPWEYTATLSFTDAALRKLKNGRLDDPSHLAVDYLRQVATKMHMRIGAMSVCVWNSQNVRPHVHMLLIGRTGRSNRTLIDCNQTKLEKCWPHGSAVVTPVTDSAGALSYLALNEKHDHTGMNLHGVRLLNRLTRELTATAA